MRRRKRQCAPAGKRHTTSSKASRATRMARSIAAPSAAGARLVCRGCKVNRRRIDMDRRKFLARGGVAAAGSLAVAQAVAQAPSLPNIRWRCASSFPKSLDTIFGGGEVIAKRVGELTGGKFQIRVFAAGEIV